MHKNTSVSAGSGVSAEKTVFPVLFALSFSHMMNDTLQSLIPSIYPLVKETFKLSFAQVGLITLTFQLTASLLQPLVGLYTDKYPKPYSLAIGMGFTLIGLVVLSMAPNFGTILLAVGLIGMGSSVFHPEASRIAHMASGGRHGMAQSLFQVGGNAGSSMGPLLAAIIIVPFGQSSVIWFSLAALLAIIVLSRVGQWYKNNLHRAPAQKKKTYDHALGHRLSRTQVIWSIVVLLFLIFSKYIYMSSLTSYYTFYLMDKFDVSVQASQVYLFVFLFAIAAGTFFGGPLGDRFGRKYVIWFSILGIAPFTLILPYVNLFWTGTLTVLIGLILSSAFSAILVYAQELIPGKVGMVSGLFFGFAFGIAGIGSAVLGDIADATSIEYVFKMCSFLPLLGLLTVFLPSEKRKRVDV
ncbi:MFS transporter [Sinomicrobium oceani]|uniref:MFS transporter n=1 Tax=Sinomicrobium oceani TaxID=1150368 RepID=UPI00227CC03B|nr:MFS transporter [Sinomicrobium oceani]